MNLILIRLQALCLLCIFFFFNIKLILLLKIYLIIKLFELIDLVIEDIDIYFLKFYNKFDPLHFIAKFDCFTLNYYNVSNLHIIRDSRYILNNLNFQQIYSFYKLTLYANKNIVSVDKYYLNHRKIFFEYAGLTYENMY